MIKHVWTVLCSQAVIDKRTNNISLHNVVEQLNIHHEPVPEAIVEHPLELMTLWARSDLEVEAMGYARMRLVDPAGEIAKEIEYIIDLTVYRRTRAGGKITKLPVDSPGVWVFRIEYRLDPDDLWQKVAEIPLEVIFNPPSALTASEPD